MIGRHHQVDHRHNAALQRRLAAIKEGDDRMEAEIDAILLAVDPKKGDHVLEKIDREYKGRHTDARFVRLLEKGDGGASAQAKAKD
jgi:hypothetical protein